MESALQLAEVVKSDVVDKGFVPVCFNIVWIGFAVTSVWLLKVSILRMSVRNTVTLNPELASHESARSSKGNPIAVRLATLDRRGFTLRG